ncbi:MAG: hypothetical protein KDA48_13725, partial [Amphiplicatus sp.]|nr:hypothetical protein [Amphiplicatus sp.]
GRIRIGIDVGGVIEQDGCLAIRFGGVGAPGAAIPLVRLNGLSFYAAHDDEMRFDFEPSGDAVQMTLDYVGGSFPFEKAN